MSVQGLLRAEGAAMALAMAAVAWDIGPPWWLVVLVLAAPDLSIAGYLLGGRAGWILYNAAHTYLVPAALAGIGLMTVNMTVIAVASLWALHIGIDRALGFGLKYRTGFRHTHLGRIGRE